MNSELFNLNFMPKDEWQVPVFLYTISYGEDTYKTFFGKSIVNIDEALKINSVIRLSYPESGITSILSLKSDFDIETIDFRCPRLNEHILNGYWQNVLTDVLWTKDLKNKIDKGFLGGCRENIDSMQEINIDKLYLESAKARDELDKYYNSPF